MIDYNLRNIIIVKKKKREFQINNLLDDSVVQLFNGIDVETEIFDFQENELRENNIVYTPYELEYFLLRWIKDYFDVVYIKSQLSTYYGKELKNPETDFPILFLANLEKHGLIDVNHFVKQWNINCNEFLEQSNEFLERETGYDFGYQYYPEIN